MAKKLSFTSTLADQCIHALQALLGARSSETNVSPIKAIAPSAAQLLVDCGITDNPRRARYILATLAKSGAIQRVEGSHSYRVLRDTVEDSRPFIPPTVLRDMEVVIRMQDEQIRALEEKFCEATAELKRYKEYLEKQAQAQQPSARVQKIMSKFLPSSTN